MVAEVTNIQSNINKISLNIIDRYIIFCKFSYNKLS